TPSVDAGILEGITRQTVIDLAREEKIEVRECVLSRHDVYVADECFLTGTAAEIAPIVKVDRRTIGTGVPGTVTQRLHEKFHALVRS
ncbi:MAG: aminotransferase class IV, partial [Planctomycetota bacterium]|nr:aminotransferase class IV [Planctomycetota bacterium]